MDITIKGVNTKLLESQRTILGSILMDDSILSCMDAQEQDALNGILNMLDDWSDNNYFRSNPVCSSLNINPDTLYKPKYRKDKLPAVLVEDNVVKYSVNSDLVSDFWVLQNIHRMRQRINMLLQTEADLWSFLESNNEE